jgi:hypothetical protein
MFCSRIAGDGWERDRWEGNRMRVLELGGGGIQREGGSTGDQRYQSKHPNQNSNLVQRSCLIEIK